MNRKMLTAILVLITSGCLLTAQNNAGNIIFSDTFADPGHASGRDKKTEFNLLDDIYFRILLETPLAETYESMNIEYDYMNEAMNFNYALQFYIDEAYHERLLFEMPPDEFRQSEKHDYALSTSDRELKLKYNYIINNWVEIADSLPEGLHKVTVKMVPSNVFLLETDVPVLASGSFKLNVDRSSAEEFMARKYTGLPMATVRDEELEIQVLDASINLFPPLEPVRAIITDVNGDWTYSYDDYGNILRRYINASVVYINSTLESNCEVRSGLYYQKHKGNGIFGELFYLRESRGYYDYPVDCSVLEVE